MAGEAYTKRYAGGFVDLPSQTTPEDSVFLNAVETALLRLLGADPIDHGVQVWSTALARMQSKLLTNAEIDPAAAIAKSKLAPLNIGNADVAAGAAIAKSKLASLNIVNSDVDAAAALAISKLAGYPTDTTKFLRGDGTWVAPPTGGATIYRLGTPAVVSNNATEQTLWTQAIPGGSIGPTGMLRITLLFALLNSAGTSQSFIVRVKFGGTTFLTTVSNNFATNATPQMAAIHLDISNINAQNVQYSDGSSSSSLEGSATATAWGTNPTVIGPAAVDTSASQNLVVTTTMSLQSVNMTTTLKQGIVEVV